MSEPIVFISTMEIHDGALEEFQEATRKAIVFAEENGPHLMGGVYIDEGEMRAHGFQVHRDSDSILKLWQLMDPHIKDVLQHATTTRVDIYGQPSDEVMEGMRRIAGSGATLTVTPRHAGFARF